MHDRVRLIAATILLLPLAGCFVSTKKHADGKGDDVNIQTPLGGMSVKTDQGQVSQKLGLAVYPGATPDAKKNNDESSADVNMNFGPFHLRVLAQGFTTTDSPDKVRAFYKKALSQYGDVIECQKGKPVNGSAARTAQGLSCAEDDHISTNNGKSGKMAVKEGDIELKAGTKSRQHIVGYEATDTGTKFGLVALELPTGMDSDDGKQAN